MAGSRRVGGDAARRSVPKPPPRGRPAEPVDELLLRLALSGNPAAARGLADRSSLPNHVVAAIAQGRARVTQPADAAETEAREAESQPPKPVPRDVAVYTDHRAAGLASLLDAKAVTYGRDVYVGAGQAPSGRLLSHELHHVDQQRGGAAFVARDEWDTSSVSPAYVATLSSEKIGTVIADLRARIPTLTDPASRLTAQENLATLEAQSTRDSDFDATFARAVPDLSASSLDSAIGMSVADPTKNAPPPIAAVGLARDAVLADYRKQARAMLLFRLDATSRFLDTVARQRLITPQYAATDETVERLRAGAEVANQLGEKVWISKRLVDAIDDITDHVAAPKGSPVDAIAGQTTVGSYGYISSAFNRSNLLARGYPPETPDILGALAQLGMRKPITDEEVTAQVKAMTSKREAWELGMDALINRGEVHDWGANVVGNRYEWKTRAYTDDEIRAAGVDAAVKDPNRRGWARDLLTAKVDDPTTPDPHAASDEELALLDRESTHPAYNWNAVRFVLARFKAEAQTRLGNDLAALDQHLDSVPPLRGYVSKWMVLLNEKLVGTGYHKIIDGDKIDPNNVASRLDEILQAMARTRNQVADDDDYLFDSAIMQSVGPIIELYGQVDPQYAVWIREVFEKNDRWREAISSLLGAAALIGFGLATVLSGGLAIGALAGGVAATVGGAVRSRMRANEIEAAALSGIAGFDQAAVANFVAWIDAGSAALAVAPVVLGGLRVAAGRIALGLREAGAAEQLGAAATGQALTRVGPTGLITARSVASSTVEWEFADAVLNPATNEVRVFVKHTASGEVFHLRMNAATGDGSLTHVASGTSVPIAGGRPLPMRPLLPPGEPVPPTSATSSAAATSGAKAPLAVLPPGAAALPAASQALAPQTMSLAGQDASGAFNGTVVIQRPLEPMSPVWRAGKSEVVHPPWSRYYGVGKGRLMTYEAAQRAGLRLSAAGPPAVTEISVAPLRGTFIALRRDLEAFRAWIRRNTGIARIDLPVGMGFDDVQGGTAAVARTDIPGLDNRRYFGASPEARVTLRQAPPLVIRSPFNTSQATRHAEEMVANQLVADMLNLPPDALRGRTIWVIVEQPPCSFCMAGLGDASEHVGILQQFSRLFPLVTIEIWNARTLELVRIRGGVVVP